MLILSGVHEASKAETSKLIIHVFPVFAHSLHPFDTSQAYHNLLLFNVMFISFRHSFGTNFYHLQTNLLTHCPVSVAIFYMFLYFQENKFYGAPKIPKKSFELGIFQRSRAPARGTRLGQRSWKTGLLPACNRVICLNVVITAMGIQHMLSLDPPLGS